MDQPCVLAPSCRPLCPAKGGRDGAGQGLCGPAEAERVLSSRARDYDMCSVSIEPAWLHRHVEKLSATANPAVVRVVLLDLTTSPYLLL